MNIAVHRAPTAANRARSAHAAPQAVKTCTAKAAARNLVGFPEELTGSIAASHNPGAIGNVPQVNHKPVAVVKISNGWR
jgi:hypothetical protein